jgi:predicted aspartyl protease
MIIGLVNQYHEATIRLVVRGPHGREHEIEAVIDTGFNGLLSCLPHSSRCLVFRFADADARF